MGGSDCNGCAYALVIAPSHVHFPDKLKIIQHVWSEIGFCCPLTFAYLNCSSSAADL